MQVMAANPLLRSVPRGVALGSVALLITGCGIQIDAGDGLDAGDTVTESFTVDDFDRLEIGGAFDVTITLGDEPSVEIRVGEKLVDDLRVDQDGDRVTIGLDNGWSTVNSDVEARITTLDLSRLGLDGAVRADVRDLDADRLELELNGASRVEGDGTVGELIIEANGASRIDFGDVTIDRVELEANGASQLNLTGAAEVGGELNGASTLDVSDDAEVDVQTEGASSIR
jgi:hypothetical protein